MRGIYPPIGDRRFSKVMQRWRRRDGGDWLFSDGYNIKDMNRYEVSFLMSSEIGSNIALV